MAVRSRENFSSSLEAGVVCALGTAGTRAVHLTQGGHRVLPPAELYPLAATASPGRSVRQRLMAVVWPPEGGLLGVVCAEARDVLERQRHVGVLVSRFATDGQPRAELQAVLQPGHMLTAHPEATPGEEPAWATAMTLDPATLNPAVMHRGEQGVDIFAAPVAGHEPLLLPDPTIWAPEAEIVWAAFTGRE